MKKILIGCIFLISVAIDTQAQQPEYPKTRKTDQSDDYFGTKVSDPYRWLEDDKSSETGSWVKAENEVTEKYLASIPFRVKVKEHMTHLWNFPKSGTPFKGGKNYFSYKNDGLQNQFVLNIIHDLNGSPVPFLDPNKLSPDGTANIGSISVSHDGKYLAYAVSKAGSDWEEIRVKTTADGTDLPDKVQWVKFSGIAWYLTGFFYSAYEAPDSANLLKGKNENHTVYYHNLSNPNGKDILTYSDQTHPQRNFGAGVTDDERYLIISGHEGTHGNNLLVKNLKNFQSIFKILVNDFGNEYDVIDNDSNILFVHTNKDAPRYKLVAMDAENPQAPWVTIIPESDDVLQSVSAGHDLIIAKYMKDARSVLKLFTRKGEFVKEIPLESIGTVEELSSDRHDENMFYSLTTFTAPATIYKYNLKTNEQTIYFRPKMDFHPEDYETKQVFYSSKDGTKIPMFITHKKGMKLNGKNPTLLFGYGGFNVSYTPQFKIERLIFLENGGVFAMPNLRGGGEYGERWHEAGTKLKKQNVFDDFIAAAEYLIKEKYTNPSKLAINGRSNGGLLVGAVMTQRPELFKVAIPTVGVMDMLRYHTFTIGWAWKGDYGSSEDEVNFKNLYSYSPLHNIKEGVSYPATLVITGDHDDRVVPAHSFKFIATLQEKAKGKNPSLIRIDVNSGHASSTPLGSNKPVSKQIEEQTDIFTFIMYNLGMKVN